MLSKALLLEFYEGDTARSYNFRYCLLVFDIVTISFLIFSSFLNGHDFLITDSLIGIALVIDFIARLWISKARTKMLFSFFGIIDLIVIASLIAPIVGEGFAFLRVIRSLRLLRSYQLLSRLRQDFKFFRRNERIILAALNLGVFIFIMTSLVYETQHYTNPKIGNYADALYFTVTALTTTGFGDIVLEGTAGRMISVLIMIFGVSLFLRLVQVILRPDKVDFRCTDCGLLTHDRDAVHCKACGKLLNIPNESEI
jgi:voltage-gated potassium channel